MRSLQTFTDRLIGLSVFIGSIGLLFEVAVVLVDVIGRAFGAPLFGSQDLISMTMVLVVFGGMALTDKIGGHVSVDLFERYFPPAFNRWVDVVSALLGAAIFLGIAWTVYDSSKISAMLNLSTNLLNLPKAWFQWALSALAVVTALAMTLRAAGLALNAPDRRENP